MPKLKNRNLIGQTFGKLTVIESLGRLPIPNSQKRPFWLCNCSCGQTCEAREDALVSGRRTSCGECLGYFHKKHGATGTPEYTAWRGMYSRCHAPADKSYHNYGGRGITVCQEWQDSFQAFFDHIGPKPGKEYSVDRIDNNRGYEPGNVRWATSSQQNLNKRNIKVKPMEWTKADIGCYWNSGEFHISSQTVIKNGRRMLGKSGYMLTKNRHQIGIFKTLQAAQLAARYGICVVCGRSTHRIPNQQRPCCDRCEKTAPTAISCPGAFTTGIAR